MQYALLDDQLKYFSKKHPGRLLTLAFVVLCVLLAQMSAATNVNAQTGASLSILPAEADLYLNDTNLATVEIWVTTVNNINAFDVTFHYDPAVVALNGWEYGDVLFPLWCPVEVHDPIAGTLRLTCAQMAGEPYAGSGVLLRLTFQGVSWGTSYLFMDPAKLSNIGVSVPVTVQNGEIITGYQPGVVVYTSLSGEISLQGSILKAGIPVSLAAGLYLGYGPYETLSLAQTDENYFFNSIVMDAYPFTTFQPRYLNLEAADGKVVGVLSSPTVMSPLVLLSGNAVWLDNNEINSDDLDAIRAAFDSTGSGLDSDVNFDGVVNVQDLALAGGNYGLTSADAYSGWVP